MDIKNNLRMLQESVAEACREKNRKPEDVNIVAVTKYVSVETALKAAEAGVVHFGENRLEGLIEKKKHLPEHVIWHFIGSLQTRKVKDVLPHADYIHSLDRLSLAEEIQKRADRTVSCFVQVNISGEESKHGLNVKEVMDFVDKLSKLDRIKVAGLMTMAPFTEDDEEIRRVFSELKKLQKTVQERNLPHAPCAELSMGMSNDFKIAVEEGATYIRIGSSLVGNEKEEVS
ncbi:YggS family pyridoxal phosphate-dependent enzyme [Fictibacillus aquaticus]|uniref:Pyridoxal phosphate homeostasis protein n=1 Tax=Fictibacillus aquaticus TaxID=2021314 RepID=A0A235FC28_9BACL|nr:YggS family pyridoxal phosphate-dependent enzyme [Fictibacillus aquaticus]OYD58930.1 YggS family pyridoxal phosphate-dependent enzyme [Fictibacillus aquaticus]